MDDEFLADVAAARAVPEQLHLWWLGQSGFLVQWQGRHLLLDPYLSDALTKKYAITRSVIRVCGWSVAAYFFVSASERYGSSSR